MIRSAAAVAALAHLAPPECRVRRAGQLQRMDGGYNPKQTHLYKSSHIVIFSRSSNIIDIFDL